MSDATVKRVLAVFAHPDDSGFFCGASLARWAALGAHVVIVVATSGGKGSADPAMTSEKLTAIREEEERKAAAELGAAEVVFLHHTDGELEANLKLRREITRQIRRVKPDLVVSLDPTVYWWGNGGINHPDHRAIGEATLAAVFPTARDRLNFPELEVDEGLDVHKTPLVYISGTAEPNVIVDVTDYLPVKLAALKHHVSQVADYDAMAERVTKRMLDPNAPLDQPRYIERFRAITIG
jgi:LmbE family N-acetylglucosaminyl deacetylase